MVKRKISMLLVAIMVATTITGINVKKTYAEEISVVQSNLQLNDGEYTIKNNTSYIEENNETGESMARSVVLEDSKLTIKDGIINMTVKFNSSMYQYLENISVSLDEKVLESQINTTDKSITFEIPSVDSKVLMDMTVNVMGRKVSFYIQNNESEISLINEAPILTGENVTIKKGEEIDLTKLVQAVDKEDGMKDVSITGDTSFVSEGKAIKSGIYNLNYEATDNSGFTSSKKITVTVLEVLGDTLEDGNYQLNNDVEYYKEGATPEDIEHGYSSARAVLSDLTKVTAKDGKITMTLLFNEKMYKFLENIKVSLDGQELTSVNDSEARTITFEVPSIDSKILLTMGITVMKNDVSFYVLNDTSTLVRVEDNSTSDEEDNSTSKPEDNSGSSSSGTQSGTQGSASSSNNSNSQIVEEEKNVTEKVTVKEYTVQNNVTHESETGVAMARKYLNSTSYIKEINGKYYVTLTFTGVDFMENHQIYVNGVKVNHTVVSSSNDSISLRFQVSTLEDKIKVNTYVSPMSRNVEFGVDLLLDTLTLVKEYTIEPDEVNNEITLPSTGDASSVSMAVLGLMASGVGVVLARKRK